MGGFDLAVLVIIAEWLMGYSHTTATFRRMPPFLLLPRRASTLALSAMRPLFKKLWRNVTIQSTRMIGRVWADKSGTHPLSSSRYVILKMSLGEREG